MFSIEVLIGVVVYLIVAGMILWLLFWLVNYCGLPEPFNKVAHVLLAVVAVLIVIGILLSLIGHPLIRWGP